MATMHGSIPRIDFAGVDPAAGPSGSPRWATLRSAVMDALRENGCFVAEIDGLVAPELSAAVLGPGGAVESLLTLPASTKARNTSEKAYRGYVGSIPGLPYESMSITDPLSPDAVCAFADLMWPDAGAGNASFCSSIQSYAVRVAVLEAAVRRMVLESVGATARYIEEQAKATSFKLRVSEYAAPAPGPGTAEGRVVLSAHRDTSFLSVLAQNDVDGIEVERGRGEGGWARPALCPRAGSFLVLAGDMLKVLTNGQVFNPLHRVVMSGDKTRYSSILFSSPQDDAVVRAVDEAVDAERPAMYRPFEYGDYIVYCYKPENLHHPKKLEAFAAAHVDG